MLTSSSSTNYVPHKHENVDQYDSYAAAHMQYHPR